MCEYHLLQAFDVFFGEFNSTSPRANADAGLFSDPHRFVLVVLAL